MRALCRHLLPVGLSIVVIVFAWVVVTLPMTGVFLLDGAFVLSEYLGFLAYAFGVALGVSLGLLFPLALLGEWLVQRSNHALWAFPLSLCLCAAAVWGIRALVLGSFLDAVLSWSGFVLLVSGLFVLYWTVLWAGRAVLGGWRRIVAHRG